MDIIILASLFPGIAILIGAVILMIFPPAEPNHWYGYRTVLSMKNKDIWQEGNRLLADRFLKGGVVLLLVGLAIQPLPEIWRVLIPSAALIPVIVWVAVTIQKRLRQKFGSDGERLDGRLEEKAPVATSPSRFPGKRQLKISSVWRTVFLLVTAMFVVTALIGIWWYNRLPQQMHVHFDLLGNPDSGTINRSTGVIAGELILLLSWIGGYLMMYFGRKQSEFAMNGFVAVMLLLPFGLIVSATWFSVLYFNLTGRFPVSPLVILLVSFGIPLFALVFRSSGGK